MPIPTLLFKGRTYPAFQGQGFAAQFAFPFANLLCKGNGLDIGCKNADWALPGAHPIDLDFDDDYDAENLPEGLFDYIFSSHMLEHYNGSWAQLLLYWQTKLDKGGILFLYLPHGTQQYWKSWNNKKHVHNFTPEIFREFFSETGWKNHFVTEYDLNNSFYAVAEK